MSLTPAQMFADPRSWADIDEWERSALALHDKGGIHLVEAPGYAPFWAVVDHAAVMDVERRAMVFHNAPRPVITSLEQDAKRQRELKALIHMDGIEHAQHRRLTADWFKPSAIGRLDDRLDSLSRSVLQRMRDMGGDCDFVPEVALPYPLQVILEILGLPETDYPRMLRLTQQLFGQEDPELQREPQSPEAREAVVQDFFDYFRSLSADRRARPTDDLATLIANGLIDGQPLGELEMLGYYIIVATAGHDTTSNAMSGGMHLLATNPDQLALLQSQPQLLVNAIEEMLRRVSPVRHFMRTVGEPTVVAGQELQPGDRLYLSYKAANLDPEVFPHPQRFDITRENAGKHVSFGYGAHFCLGAQLARNEMRSLFSHLVPRLQHLELRGEPRMSRTSLVGGWKNLPIGFALAAD
jgi:cytochrome P450